MLVSLVLGAAACAATPRDDQKNAPPASQSGEAEKSAQDAQKKAQLELQVPIERNKVTRAKMDVEAAKRSSTAAIDKAKAELALAEEARKRFVEIEAPLKEAREQLDLQEAQDSLADNREELEQLEMMYKEDDLADKTKEIVLRRGKRRLERSEDRLKLQERERASLPGELEQSRIKLEQAVTDKKVELERAQRAADGEALEKETALLSAQAELARVEAELAELNNKAGAQPHP
jgi:hypothetical protein